VLARAEASTVKVFNDQGLGTGVIVGKNRVVTAAHVVGPNATMSILLPNGDVKPGKVLWTGKAPKEDVALIEVDTGRNRVAYLNCNQVKSGDTVYAYGFPLGIRRVFVKGMVAGNDALKDVVLMSPEAAEANLPNGLTLLNLDIIFGNSGGGVWNEYGELVGLAELLVPVPIGYGYSLSGLSAMTSSTEVCKLLNR